MPVGGSPGQQSKTPAQKIQARVFDMDALTSPPCLEREVVGRATPVATGNIGCIAQIASGTSIPVLHTIELLDFAHGGPTPDGLARLAG